MSALNTQLSRDYLLTSPDAHAIAYQWVKYRAAQNGTVPAAADLAEAITGIAPDLVMQGAPQLEIDIYDPNWNLLDSGFFDPQNTGVLDKVEINYPQGSRYYWRLRQFSPQQGSPYTVQTFWWPRVVDDLDNLHGPFSASRSRRTRAQFMKMCVEKIHSGYTANFYSKQLDVKQPIANISVSASASDTTTSGPKSVGMSDKARKSATVAGSPMTSAQADVASTLLRVADQLNAGHIATEALIYAAIWESKLNKNAGPNSEGFWGVLSGKQTEWAQTDVTGMATAFLQGNSSRGFQGGGAIHLAATGTGNPIEIAVMVEVPSIWPDNAYAAEGGYPGDTAALAEVDNIIELGGGASGAGGVKASTIEVVQNYNFQIGTSSDPREDFWTGMNRLAQEVNWELVVDGDDVYYDSDRTLIRDQIVDVITRDQVGEDDWSYDWDKNLVVANFELVLECDPFQYRPADVLLVKKFGPASVGKSSVGLPGRWLVGEISRNAGDIVSTLTLLQPTAPLPEPAPTVREASSGAGGASVVGQASPGTVLAAVAAAQRLSGWKVPYVYGGNHTPTGDTVTDANTLRASGMDCSSSSSWVLYQAGLLKNAQPLTAEEFMTWGDAGPGQELTIWACSYHVFLEFNVPGIGHFQMNTVNPGSVGPRVEPWTYSNVDAGEGAAAGFTPRHAPGT